MSQNKSCHNMSIEKKIISVQNSLSSQIKQLDNIKAYLKNDKEFLINDVLQKSIINIEKDVFSLRNLYGFISNLNSFNITKNENYIQIPNNFDIEINKNDYGYHISLPLTLPKYGEKYKSLLVANLMNKLRIFNQQNPILKYNKAVFVFINNISNNVSENKIRDNDNYEYKDIVNTLAFWFLPDDSYKCCNIYNGTKISNKNSTEIYIIPTNNFADFYKNNQNLLS